MNNFEYTGVTDAAEAVNEVTGTNKASFIAGGTNLLDLLKYNITTTDKVVDINRLNEYHTITEIEGRWPAFRCPCY